MKSLLLWAMVSIIAGSALAQGDYPKAGTRKSSRPKSSQQTPVEKEVTNVGDTIVFRKSSPVHTEFDSLRNSDNPELSTEQQVGSLRNLIELQAGTKASVNQVRTFQGTFGEKRACGMIVLSGPHSGRQVWCTDYLKIDVWRKQ